MKEAHVIYQGESLTLRVEGDELNLGSGEKLGMDDPSLTYLPPSRGTMFALGLNYSDHAAELDFKPPTNPLIFLKANNTLTGHKSHCVRPDDATYMHYECELVVIIGRRARNISEAEALDYVKGYTICNDYAIRDYLENYYRPNLRVKSRDGLTPIGPYMVTKDEISDPHNLRLRTYVNGVLTQEGSTKDMIFNIPYLISYLSAFMTLQPGDMIATGTPKGLANVVAGDEVRTEIEGIGSLVSYITTQSKG